LQATMWQAQVVAGGSWLTLNPPTSGALTYPSQAPLILAINATGRPPGLHVGVVRMTTDRGQQLDIRVQLLLYVHQVMVPVMAR